MVELGFEQGSLAFPGPHLQSTRTNLSTSFKLTLLKEWPAARQFTLPISTSPSGHCLPQILSLLACFPQLMPHPLIPQATSLGILMTAPHPSPWSTGAPVTSPLLPRPHASFRSSLHDSYLNQLNFLTWLLG